MHSLETGIVVSIAAFFFFSFLTFVFLRETNISNEILEKNDKEKLCYQIDGEGQYRPEIFNNVVNIIIEEGKLNERENEE